MDNLTPTQQLAERIRETHYAVCTSEDHNVSHGDGPVYTHSRHLFLAAIKAAYPDMDAEEIYAVWVDCMETVAYCARIVRQRRISEAQARQCLAAIERQFAPYIDQTCRPTLAKPGEQCSGWAIVWEDGPDEWALRAFHGGHDEELYHLAREAGATPEQARRTAQVGGVPCPAGVFAEPVMTFVLGLYPDA
jgi:hypothetical protein